MEATIENLNKIKAALGIDFIFLRQRYYRLLGEEGCRQMFDTVDKKIIRMLPSYDGKIPVKDAFGDIIARTAANFVKEY